MEIEGDMIIFNSASMFYELEESGLKSNTVRVLDKTDTLCLKQADIKKIRIINIATGESFDRVLSNITQYFAYQNQVRAFYENTECEGLYDGSVWIFSWKHSESAK